MGEETKQADMAVQEVQPQRDSCMLVPRQLMAAH